MTEYFTVIGMWVGGEPIPYLVVEEGAGHGTCHIEEIDPPGQAQYEWWMETVAATMPLGLQDLGVIGARQARASRDNNYLTTRIKQLEEQLKEAQEALKYATHSLER